MDAEDVTQLSEVLDRLEKSVEGNDVAIEDLLGGMGQHSFASIMLMFALISTSPASAIPGITAMVAVVEFVLVVQLLARRRTPWLPRFITSRRISTEKLCRGIQWLRKPIHWAERLLRPRWTFLIHPPWIYVPLLLVLSLTLFMPVMEVIPTSGSIASAVIALFAAGLLTRDGLVVALSMLLLAAVPFAVWQFGFSA